jgi:tRNA(Ile)-lysidine synthase
MHPLAARALRTIRRHALIPRGGRVLAAVSGGSDSVAMLWLLKELEAAGELVCAGLAHVNHGLRPGTAARDQAFCEDLAARLDLPVAVGTIDVTAIARDHRTSIEGAARIGRYAFLQDAMTGVGAATVAVGHTRDDQAETFLLRMIRGAGSRGRRAIHPRRGVFVRPLLDIGRDELREYLRERDLPFVEDETNADVAFTRNRIRHEVMPLLRDRFSPSIARVLARNAAIAAADEAWLSAHARELFARTVRLEPDRVVVDRGTLTEAAPSLSLRVALEAIAAAAALAPPAARPATFADAQTLLDVAADEGPRSADLAGVTAERIQSDVVLTKKTARARPARNSFTYALSIPGEVWLAEAGCAISAHQMPAADGRALMSQHRYGGCIAMVAADRLPPAVTVRNRRPGDAFRPFGLGGRKKLQDFLVDRKVRRMDRDLVPLVVDDRDRIVWVAGHTISEEFRVPDGAQAVVILRLKTNADAARTPAARQG